jgi:two-component system invasion response regulator UvrY
MTSIAYIEHQALFRELMTQTILKKFPQFRIHPYTDGKAFCEKFPTEDYIPGIILMDVSLPEKNGYEILEWLGRHYPDIPVLILSFIRENDAIVLLSRLGAKGVISKNASLDTVFRAIESVMQGGYFYTASLSGCAVGHSLHTNRTFTEGLSALTHTERRILGLLYLDKTREEISSTVNISRKTYEKHKQHISEKLGIRTREGLIMYAIRTGIIYPDNV